MRITTRDLDIVADIQQIEVIHLSDGVARHVMHLEPPVADELRRLLKVALEETGYLE